MENETYVEVNGDNLAIGINFSKVDIANRTVEGFATLDNIDKTGEIVDFEASREAFKSWLGNIREMHGPLAVGKALSVEERKQGNHDGMYVKAYISKGAEDTWQKILDGTLQGFSIGGRVYEKRPELVKTDDSRYGAKQAYRITRYSLGELSVVDNPANPLALFEDIKKFQTLVKSEADGLHLTEVITPDERTVLYCKDCDIARVTKSADNSCDICDNTMMTVAVTWEDISAEEVHKMVKEAMSKEIERLSGARVEKVTFAVKDSAETTPRTDPVTSTQATDVSVAVEVEEAVEADAGEVGRAETQKREDAENESFPPIKNIEDLLNAIKSFGRVQTMTQFRDYIIRSAKEIGHEEVLPEQWKKSELLSNDNGDNNVNKVLQDLVDALSKKLGEDNLVKAQGGDFEKVDTQALNSILEVLKGAFSNVEEILTKAGVQSLNSENSSDTTVATSASLPGGASADGAVPGKISTSGTGAQMDSWDSPPSDANVLPHMSKSEDGDEVEVATEEVVKSEEAEEVTQEATPTGDDLLKSYISEELTKLADKTAEAFTTLTERIDAIENSGAGKKSGEVAEDLAKSADNSSFWGGFFGVKNS